MKQWQLQDAKNRFSEVVKDAVSKGPQFVTKRGVKTVVVISVDEYRKLTRRKSSLVDFFRESPLKDVELDLERLDGSLREIDL